MTAPAGAQERAVDDVAARSGIGAEPFAVPLTLGLAVGALVSLLLVTLVVPSGAARLLGRLSGGGVLDGIGFDADPTDRLIYLAGLAGVVVAALSSLLMPGLLRRFPSRIWVVVALTAQVIGVAGVVWCWFEQRRMHAFFSPATFVVAVVVVVGTVLLWRQRSALVAGNPETEHASRRAEVTGAVIATVATGWWLVPSLYSDGNIGASDGNVHWHMAFNMNEFAAITNGLTPTIDFVPQYSNILGLLLAPLFAVTGVGVGTFTWILTALTLVALLAVYAVLRMCTRGPGVALALFLPVLATSTIILLDFGIERVTVANMHQGFPLRFFLPMLLLLATCAWSRGSQGSAATVALGALGALTFINNVEFGFPALAGSVFAVLCLRWQSGPAGQRVPSLARAAYPLLGGGVLGFALFAAVVLARTGSVPNPLAPLQFAAMFGASGLGALPMAAVGAHLVVFATFAAALVAAVLLASRSEPLLRPELTASIAFAGLYGLGGSVYFTGRSHPWSLVTLLPAWALTIALLAAAALALLPRRIDSPFPLVLVIPVLLVVAHLGMMVGVIGQVPRPDLQLQRLSATTSQDFYGVEAMARYVAVHVPRGQEVAIMTRVPHLVAEEAGVRNRFPFASVESIATQRQVQFTFEQLDETDVRTLFIAGSLAHPAVVDAARERGFVQQGEADPATDVSLWRR
jgi:hypothetical protein